MKIRQKETAPAATGTESKENMKFNIANIIPPKQCGVKE